VKADSAQADEHEIYHAPLIARRTSADWLDAPREDGSGRSWGS
jgi:hypothetical protein